MINGSNCSHILLSTILKCYNLIIDPYWWYKVLRLDILRGLFIFKGRGFLMRAAIILSALIRRVVPILLKFSLSLLLLTRLGIKINLVAFFKGKDKFLANYLAFKKIRKISRITISYLLRRPLKVRSSKLLFKKKHSGNKNPVTNSSHLVTRTLLTFIPTQR